MKVTFGKPSGDFDYVITWRGGSRLWMPEPAPELVLLKGLGKEAAFAKSTVLEVLAAVSSKRWRELYALARFVDYEGPPDPPVAMWYTDADLAVTAARGLSEEEAEVLLELPQLSDLHAALLAGSEVTVCVSGSASVAGADEVVWKPRAAARAVLRSSGLLGGAWSTATLPKLESSWEEWEPRRGEAVASFERYEPPAAPGSLPEPRDLDPLLDLAFGDDAELAFALLRDVATGPLPLRSVPELGQYAPLLRDLILYGYATVERDVVRLTEKGLYALLQKMGGG